MSQKSGHVDEPSSSMGQYFRIFAHFASCVTLAVTLTSSRPCYCSAEVILLLTVFSLLVHLLFCLFRFFFAFVTHFLASHAMSHTERYVSRSYRLVLASLGYFSANFGRFHIFALYSISFRLFALLYIIPHALRRPRLHA
jgi:hypothetical protein